MNTLREYIKFELGCSDETLYAMLVDKFYDDNRVHNWRNYVDNRFILEWNTLSEEVKLVIFLMAERQANREEWD
jgi:hypothetical protein